MPDRNIAQELTVMSDRELACRGREHPWPQIDVTEPLPAGIRLEAWSEGRIEIQEICPRCDKMRSSITLPGSLIVDHTIKRVYRDPEDWHRFRRGDYSKQDMADELMRRVQENHQLDIQRVLKGQKSDAA